MPYTPPSHTPFPWHDYPATDTPLSAAQLEAAETDLIDYTQAVITDYDAYAAGRTGGTTTAIDVTSSPYSAKNDGVVLTDGVVLGGSLSHLGSASATFTVADVGKLVSVKGAAAYRINGNTHSNSTIDGLSNTAGMYVGMTVSGSGIPANTSVLAVTGTASITISHNATTTLTATQITFGNHLSTTIASFINSTTVGLTTAADIAVSGAEVTYGTDNFASLSSAYTAAQTANVALFHPNGIYCAHFLPGGTANTLPTFDGMMIYGESRAATIRAFPDGATNIWWHPFEFNGAMSASFERLTLLGPAGYMSNGSASGVLHYGPSGTLRFKNVRIAQFSVGIQLNTPPGVTGNQVCIETDDCDIEGWANGSTVHIGVGAFDTDRTSEKYIHLHNTRFRYFGDPAGSPYHHALYAYTCWDVAVNECDFYSCVGGPGNVIQAYDTSVTPANAANYFDVQDCRFHPSCGTAQGMITSYNTPTTVKDCLFLNPNASAIQQAGLANIEANLFISSGVSGAFPIFMGNPDTAGVVTDGSISAGSTALHSTAAVFVTGDAGKWVAVKGAGAAGAPLRSTIVSVSGGIATLADAAVNSVTSAVVTWGVGYPHTGRIANNMFRGPLNNAAIRLFQPDVDVDIHENHFSGTTGSNFEAYVYLETGSTTGGVSADIRNNTFEDSPYACVRVAQAAGQVSLVGNRFWHKSGTGFYVSGVVASSIVNLVSNDFSPTGSGTVVNLNTTPTNYLSKGNFGTIGLSDSAPTFDIWVKRDYGAKGDVTVLADGVITGGALGTLNSASANFTIADRNKLVYVNGAGAAGAVLSTTISAIVDASHVTLTTPASTAVSGATFGYGTNDSTSLNNAITAAGAFREVHVEPGVYWADTSTLSLNCVNGTVIEGEDYNTTAIRAWPEASGVNRYLATASGTANITFKKIQLRGPDSFSTGTYLGIFNQATAGTITLRDAWMRRFTTGIYNSTTSNTVTIDVDRSIIEGCGGSPASTCIQSTAGAATVYAGKSVRLHNTRFTAFGDSTPGPGYGLTVDTSWDLDVAHCRFDTRYGNGYDIRIYDTSVSAANAAQSVMLVDNTHAADTSAVVGLLTSYNTTTHVSSCRFLNQTAPGVLICGDTQIADSFFAVGASQSHAITTGSQGQGTGLPYGGQISDCTFRGPQSASASALRWNVAGILRAKDLRFSGALSTAGWYISLELAGGTLIVDGCSFEGAPEHSIRGSAAATMIVRNNDFLTTSGNAVRNSTTSLSYLAVFGNNFSQVGGSTTSISLQVGPNVLETGDNYGSSGYSTSTSSATLQRTPYSADSPFNKEVTVAAPDSTSTAVVAAISANQINAGQPSGLMSTTLDPTTQFASPLFNAANAIVKSATAETGQLALYIGGVYTQVTSPIVPITRTNSYAHEINVPGNWGDLVSDGAGDNNAVVANWSTGESYDIHGLASSVTKLLSATPQKQTVGTVNIAGTTGAITVPSGGVPIGVLLCVAFSSQQGQTVTSIADTRLNAWHKVATDGSAQNQTCELWYTYPTTALLAADSITLTCPSSHSVAEAFWFTNSNGGALDTSAFSHTATASITTAGADLVIAVDARDASSYSYGSPWIADDINHETVANSYVSTAHQIQTVAGAIATPESGTTSSPFVTVIIAAFTLTATVRAGGYPSGGTLIATNSPVWPSVSDKLRIGTPGGSNWETVTVSAGASAVGGLLTISALANTHPVNDLVIDSWTTTSLAGTGVTSVVVPNAAVYLNNGPQHFIIDLGEANQETVLMSALSGTTATIGATTKTHGSNASIAALSASNTAYWNVASGGLNSDGIPARSSTANSNFSNSGAGLSYLAGLITAWDAQQGVIHHAIGVNIMDGAPNINTDGTFNSLGATPGPYFKLPATNSDQNAPYSVGAGGWTTGTAGGTSLLRAANSGNSAGLATGEQVIVGYGTANAETLTISTFPDGTHITFSGALAHNHTAGEYICPAGAIPMGARLRLKQSWQAPAGKSTLFYMVVDALKRYGTFFRDGGGHSKATFESQITAQWGVGSTPAIVAADLGLIPLAQFELLTLQS